MNGLILKYFVLAPTSSDQQYAHASREAMRTFAAFIQGTNPQLASDLRQWANESIIHSEYSDESNGNEAAATGSAEIRAALDQGPDGTR